MRNARTTRGKPFNYSNPAESSENWAPYTSKDEALAYLNNTIGVLTIKARILPKPCQSAQGGTA